MDSTCINVYLFGVIGDAALQVISAKTSKGDEWGLKTHFQEHGWLSSLFIAGGMTTGTYWLAQIVARGKPSMVILGATGALLDVMFRRYMLMPSLRGYYSKLSPGMSAFWGAFPAALMYYL